MTVQEILEKVESAGISISSFAYCDFNSEEIGLGEYDEVEQEGGEDEGSYWTSVKYFKDHDVYIKTEGHYTSYHGTYFYDGYGKEVKPFQKTITVYE